jgi:hypothetical protein
MCRQICSTVKFADGTFVKYFGVQEQNCKLRVLKFDILSRVDRFLVFLEFA